MSFKRYWTKAEIVRAVVGYLVEHEIIGEEAMDICEPQKGTSEITLKQLEQEEREREKERRFQILLMEKEIEKAEKIAAEKEKERAHQLALLEKKAQLGMRHDSDSDRFDIYKSVRLVPSFDEDQPDEFFIQFEKLARQFDWPVEKWTALIQGKLVGKGKTAYNSIVSPHSEDYDYVKKAILDAYQLTAEYYREKFRSVHKEQNKTYAEFAHYVNVLKDKWLSASKVETLDDLKELIVLEQFLNGIPLDVKTYLLEREVTTLKRAASLAEDYSLVHKPKVRNNFNPKK